MYNYFIIIHAAMNNARRMTADILKGNGPAIPAADFNDVIRVLMKPSMGFKSHLDLLVVNAGDCQHSDKPLVWTGSDLVYFEAFELENLQLSEAKRMAEYSLCPLVNVKEDGYPTMENFMDFLPEGADNAVLLRFYQHNDLDVAEEWVKSHVYLDYTDLNADAVWDAMCEETDFVKALSDCDTKADIEAAAQEYLEYVFEMFGREEFCIDVLNGEDDYNETLIEEDECDW